MVKQNLCAIRRFEGRSFRPRPPLRALQLRMYCLCERRANGLYFHNELSMHVVNILFLQNVFGLLRSTRQNVVKSPGSNCPSTHGGGNAVYGRTRNPNDKV